MRFLKRVSVFILAVLLISFMGSAAGPKSPVKGLKKIESTDPAFRLKWFAEHTALKAQTPFKSLSWRFIGPDIISGRCTDIAVPKGSKFTFYVGASTSGVWKTENAGITWKPLMDEEATQSIGDIAISDSNPEIIWVGTGEANIFRASTAGAGVYKSTDSGKTWSHMGLAATQTIGRIVIHPANPDVVYVAASGHEWTYNPDRGVFKTVDGGKTWQNVLFTSERAGAIDIVMDPKDPETLYASLWNRIRRRWSDPIPSGEDGLFKTTDGGKSWKPLTAGLPDTNYTGRVGIDIARGNPNVLYAFVDNHTPGREPRQGELDSYGRQKTERAPTGAEVYRSDDKGESWRKVSPSDPRMEQFSGTYGWVFGQIRVDPNDENTVYIMGLSLAKSSDGGKSFRNLYFAGLHGDHHGLWIDPADSRYLINVNDGGVNVSYDGGETWRDFHTHHPLIQFYNIAYDMDKPFHVYGSVQDHGTYKGIVSSFYGRLMRSELKNGQWETKDIAPKAGQGEPPLRGQWLAPTLLSPHNPMIIYHGFQYLYRSLDRGQTWERISPDLSANDPEKQGKWPFAIPYACLTAISESPFKFGLIYAGTDDGRVWITKNSGEAWTEITAGLPYNKHVSRLVASQYDPATVYLTLNGRRDDDFADYVYKSADYPGISRADRSMSSAKTPRTSPSSTSGPISAFIRPSMAARPGTTWEAAFPTLTSGTSSSIPGTILW
jgi:photosystem II stability/assembly factor-like uncharacterized protein